MNFEKWSTLLEPKPGTAPAGTEPAPHSVRSGVARPTDANRNEATRTEAPRNSPTSFDPDELEAAPSTNSGPSPKPSDNEATVLSVSDLNGLIKKQLEGQFSTVWIQGEISNFKPHTSGHFYFSLKDDGSQISAVMFKGFNNKLKFKPENGMEVVVRGRVTVYEPRGNYQVFCETMEPVGAGALQKAFEQLKAKLQSEGLFEARFKKPLPSLPKHIGVVTSPTGAAIQDILNVLGRRYKGAQVTVIPARVQGTGAAQEVVRGIELANRIGGYDVLIVGRGGGSVEDMWCFNEEIVARAIFASEIPIISAVGHEIDFTIADFVADYRAPTPSAAAEIVAKSAAELVEKVTQTERRLRQSVQHRLGQWQTRVLHLQSRLVDPKRRLEDLVLRCDELTQRLQNGWQRYATDRGLRIRLLQGRLKTPQSLIDFKKQKLKHHTGVLQKDILQLLKTHRETLSSNMSLLDSLSPLKVVHRGYAIVFKGEAVIRNAADVKAGDEVQIQLAEGAMAAKVIGPEKSRFKK